MLKTILIISINIFLVRTIPWSKNADPVVVNDVVFHKLGTYRGFTDEGSEFQKSYFFSKYSMSPWAEGRSFCSSYNLEFLSMDTLEEARAVLTMGDNHSVFRAQPYVWLNIDGVALTLKSPTDWYWTGSGKKISYAIPWRPGNPNNAGKNEYCLQIGRGLYDTFGFDDAPCDEKSFIACQRYEFLIPQL